MRPSSVRRRMCPSSQAPAQHASEPRPHAVDRHTVVATPPSENHDTSRRLLQARAVGHLHDPTPSALTIPGVPHARISLDDAARHARTGDLWLFRGRSPADRAIQAITSSPVNHVGMAVVLDDLPPLLWHADAGRVLRDLWTGTRQSGAQLHDLRSAVVVWARRYGQRAWLRQLDHTVDRAAENALLRVITQVDGAPYPTPARLAAGWLKARAGRFARFVPGMANEVHCAQVVAHAYDAMGLLPAGRPAAWYDPGRFWSGRGQRLNRGAQLLEEVTVHLPARHASLARAL